MSLGWPGNASGGPPGRAGGSVWGGPDVAAEFRSQEIDGQALLLLTEDHLVSTMNLKLGPALKLCAHINSLKDA
ncbi:hypothetical protein L3Q82_021331 [Scortum barcoo]|uniref:Uncharacterized protein n=1 Tax=Scortum barcoo TaxID=214431 RepID=A0ACB8X4B4_9TELE|nr:hypothetical protein L3Q82_021331 [Scortum barcoo]